MFCKKKNRLRRVDVKLLRENFTFYVRDRMAALAIFTDKLAELWVTLYSRNISNIAPTAMTNGNGMMPRIRCQWIRRFSLSRVSPSR